MLFGFCEISGIVWADKEVILYKKLHMSKLETETQDRVMSHQLRAGFLKPIPYDSIW